MPSMTVARMSRRKPEILASMPIMTVLLQAGAAPAGRLVLPVQDKSKSLYRYILLSLLYNALLNYKSLYTYILLHSYIMHYYIIKVYICTYCFTLI